MAKRVAPVTLTGGTGYSFEDQVAAWFLVHLLCGEIPLEPEFGVPISVDFQVRESGWLLDDLLITSRGEEEMERRLAVSVKRDRQVTQGGFPSDFVKTLWQQWLGLDITANPLQKELDLLCLATGQLADGVKSAWDEILQQSLLTAPARLAKRLISQGSSNEIQRTLFASLRCPEDLARTVKIQDIDTATASLLPHIRLLHFDFRSSPSRNLTTAIRLCQLCLKGNSLQEANDLWDNLVAIAAKLRRGGSLDLPQLLHRLNRYSFEEYPNYRADWNTLRELGFDAIATVRTELGPGITISRESLLHTISTRLEELGWLVLLGESGSGKSALTKSIATSENYQRTVWLNGYHLEGQGLNTVKQLLGLDHNLTDILPSVGERRALLVLDALGKFSSRALQNTAELIKVLKLNARTSRWHILMTSQPLRWECVQLQLYRCGLQLPQELIFQIELPDSSTLIPVIRALPSLRRPILQPELGELLRNLKVLDWVASTISSSPRDSGDWIGLSDIVDSVWSWWIKSDHRRYARDGVLKTVSVEETRSFSGVVSLDRLTTLDREVLADLEDMRLVNVREGKVSFTHDLLGDWSRLQILIAVPQHRLVNELRDRVANPHWHAAIRLYGLRTLERAPDSSSWFQLLQQLDDDSDLGQLAADLVLEAVAFANNAYSLLERTWPQLSANEGFLLKKLLRRFRHSATFPDPRMAALASDNNLSVWLASSMRIPFWPHWEPMLLFLHAHAHEVRKLALEPAGELCHLWLSQMPARTKDGKPFPWRRQTAELALILAREVQGLQAEDVIITGEGYESVYEAFLYAASDLPEQVSVLALELAKRRPPALEIQKRAEKSARRQAEEHEKRLEEDSEYRARLAESLPSSLPFGLEVYQDPWPAGPTERVDDTFREVCLDKGALRLLMEECPEVAREVILALCIEPPQPEFYRGDLIRGMKHGTVRSTKSAMFFSGPFLLFLQVNSDKAIDLVVELVDFATERWQEWTNLEDGISVDPEVGEDRTVDIWIDGSRRTLIGDSRVFGWYRERLVDAPYVVSALMALEKWFYNKVEANEDISEWVDLVLQNTRSMAFIGVLVALGKKYPELLFGCLKPIMSVWQVYEWDWVITQEDTSGVVARISLMLWVRLGEEIFNTVRDWHAMPHRKIYFRNLVVQMLLTYPELQHYFGGLREEWRTLLKPTGTAPGSLEFLIERFDPANYSCQENEDGQLIAFEWPEHLREDSQASLQASSYSLNLISFPLKCRKVLESGILLDPSELENLWQTLEYFVSEFEEYGESIEHLNNAVMAGIAVLTILHQEWLETDDEKTDWCARQIERIVAAGYTRKVFDPPESVYDVRWQVFLGEIAIHLLAENPTDENIRFLTAQGVLAYHYNTTGLVCKVAYRLREDLGEEFGRLLNLCRLWAGIRWGLKTCESRQVDSPQLKDWYDSALKSFVEQSLQSTPVPFNEIAMRSEKLIRETVVAQELEASEGKAPSRSHPGLDWQVIQAAYAWLPPLAEASSEQERATWIAICEELLQLVLIYIQTASRDEWGEVKGTPYQSEYWVVSIIANLVPQLCENEHPECFWQPILDLGAAAHYWVNSFLSGWFISGSKMASEPANFARHWRSMVEYALESPLWRNDPSTPGRFQLTDLYIQLMGLGLGGTVFDQEEYGDAVELLFPLYEKWAAEWLKYSRVAAAFARFLIKPAARGMMLPGLTWLAQASPQITDRGWDRDRLSDDLLSLLHICWQRHLPELETDNEVKRAFLDLLNALVVREHPGALELRDVMLG